MSKNHKEMSKALPTIKKLVTLKSIGSNSPSPEPMRSKATAGTAPGIAHTYARKENK